jgi:hypothetical protein
MIYFFGSSHTAGMYDATNSYYETYIHIPYSVRLAKKLNMEYKNLAKGNSPIDRNSFLLTKNLSNIISEAKIVLFQADGFNSHLMRFIEDGIGYDIVGWKDIVFGRQVFPGHQNEYLSFLDKKKFTTEDKFVVTSWFNDFQHKITWYDLRKVYLLFDYIETFGIKCYMLYWDPTCDERDKNGKDIYYIKDRRNILFEDELNASHAIPHITITDETEGKIDDPHHGNGPNEILAEHIFNFIKNSDNG